jgi:CelD/BcsL family acetyltransferase involved in cellulose biosynthesis
MASIEIVTSAGRWASLANQWDALVGAARGSVYQTCPWLSSWWDCPGEDLATDKRQLAIFLVWERNSLVGIAPFFLHRRFRLSIEIERRLRLLGDGGASNRHDFVALPGHEALVGELVAKELLRERLADRIFLNDVPEESATLQAFVATMQRCDASIHESMRLERYTTLIPRSFEDFLTGLGQKRRWEYRRAAEASERLGVTIEVASAQGSPLDATLEAALELHCKRWDAAGGVTPFSWPGRRRQLFRAVQSLHERGWLHLAVLKQGARMLAASLQFFYPPARTAYRHFEARDLNWMAFAPGKYLITVVFEHMIHAGLVQCDHGRGEEDYKKMYKPIVMHRNHSLRVIPALRYLHPVRRTLSRTVNGLRYVRRWLAPGESPVTGNRLRWVSQTRLEKQLARHEERGSNSRSSTNPVAG